MISSFCLLALSAAALAVPQHLEKTVGDHRIVNGTDAPQGKYPFQVSVQWFGSHTCGGSILNENWVLTAAHCVAGEGPDAFSVYAGSVDLEGDGERRAAAEIIVHENFNPYNDIALIRVANPFTFNDNINGVTLPNQNQDIEGGTTASVIGWGSVFTGGDVVQLLQEVEIFIVDDPDCAEVLPGQLVPSNICAGIPEGGKGQCTGDSGGPLLVNDQQVGIVSWSVKPCTVPPYPGVYTEVAWFIDWINSHITRNL